MTVDHEGGQPLYIQLADILRDAIKRGDYQPGRLIPSETRLSQENGINRLTVRKAVHLLTEEGLVKSVPGRGVYVVGGTGRRTADRPQV